MGMVMPSVHLMGAVETWTKANTMWFLHLHSVLMEKCLQVEAGMAP
jgi:hypothetical protein